MGRHKGPGLILSPAKQTQPKKTASAPTHSSECGGGADNQQVDRYVVAPEEGLRRSCGVAVDSPS